MIIHEHVIDYIIKEFGDYNPCFQDILKELGVKKEELSEEQIALIVSKVGE